MKFVFLIAMIVFSLGFSVAGQNLISPQIKNSRIPEAFLLKIIKAEDARDFAAIEPMLTNPNVTVRWRASLAAGRIGDERAVPALIGLLSDESIEVRSMAAFALGETESVAAAEAIIEILHDPKTPELARAAAIEAAGKIAAANAKDEKAKSLGASILKELAAVEDKRMAPVSNMIRLGLTAALRARPAGADEVVREFLANSDPVIVADALNTLSRLRAKNANREALELLAKNQDAVIRANAARLLGAAEDKEAVDLLIEKATRDSDSRVRVSAIRALSAIKDAAAAEPLLKHGELLLQSYSKANKPNFIPNEQSEFIEVAVALGRLLANTDNPRADKLFADFGKLDKGRTPEVYIARVRVGPKRGDGSSPELTDWRQYSTLAQVVGEFSAIDPASDIGKQMKVEAPDILRPLAKAFAEADPVAEAATIKAGPDVLQAYARFKTLDLSELLLSALKNRDVQIRATAANLLGGLDGSDANVGALKTAFARALIIDKRDNDAQLAILDAVAKLDKNRAVGTFLLALDAPDYLVRKRAFALLDDKELKRDFPGIRVSLEDARAKRKNHVLPFTPISGSKLGQILNTDADYRRALSRKNGSVKAVVTTEKGAFTIDFLPEEAPLTVDNFIKLARSGYFNGLEVHRVVPNFVMQDGDPRGDGNGGPGWSIRCEVNTIPYDRGAVGMALSGKDTGGSQWFVTHAPQPHLDGGYPVFGHVNETGMKVVDNIVRGDKILTVKIVENSSKKKTSRKK